MSTYDREPDPSDYDEDYADIHSCHYGCIRLGCIRRQRDELRGYAMGIYEAVTLLKPEHRMTFQGVMKYAEERLKEKV